MDELKLKTHFMKNIISKIISKQIEKKMDVMVDVRIQDLNVTFDGDVANVSMSIDGLIGKDEIMKILSSGKI